MFSAYHVDVVVKAAGHDVVRLPPYLCELNPIELIWSQRIEEEFWQRDGIIVASLDRLGISLLSDTSSESDASDSEMSEMEEPLEQTFSLKTLNKSRLRSLSTNVTLQDAPRISNE
ncbi:hypothetical protein HPB49_004259 [Dermacentor silvarum]|uniref:Uncharacterized protein n=1 Tax=Dermacentor silvarum TaxID=543639 RepID=A0ACB8DU47_DERSI|nr:hypothetical protein HPB49_004259 [Dermacentor silvarum]